MERQQEYELRKKIADAIQNDVDRVYIGTYIGCSYPIGRFRFQRKDMFLV